MPCEDLVRRLFDAFFTQDRAVAEQLLADGFTFTSPLDDHLSKGEYFERCWPNAKRLRDFRIETLVAGDGEVFVRYRAIRVADGVAFRNTELIRCAGDRIASVEVFFGAEEPTRSPASSS